MPPRGLVDDIAAANDRFTEVENLHTFCRVHDLGQTDTRCGSSRSGFRARADIELGRRSGTELQLIAERVTGYFAGPEEANSDVNIIGGTCAEDSLRTGSAQGDDSRSVAIGDDTVLGVVLDDIITRAALDLSPV